MVSYLLLTEAATMYDSICDYLREEAVKKLFSTKSFNNCWPIWQPEMRRLLGRTPSATSIIDLGDQLTRIFTLTRAGGRSQSSVSGGGTAWEGIVCWYLNFCLMGSRTVVIKQNKNLIPDPIAKAITVSYGSSPSNTESDLIAITFPNIGEYTSDKSTIAIRDTSNQQIPAIVRQKFNYKPIINYLVERDFNDCEIGIIQCKTNWNDNAQIPMLWDMVYMASGFTSRNISVGNSAFSIRSVHRFTYSFITVPTSRGAFLPTSLCVKRVQNISGGNYWGKPTIPSVANSIKDIFAKNFNNGAIVNLRTDLNTALPHLSTHFSYFNI